MRKILLSLASISAVGVMAFMATSAFFSDTETSVGNLFQAGAIDLLIDSQAHYAGLVCTDNGWAIENTDNGTTRTDLVGDECDGTWESTDLIASAHRFFNFSDIKPGDEGENTISMTVMDNDAYVCMHINNMQDNDNDLTEPESEVDPDGLASGELAENLHFTAWIDQGTTPGFQNDEDPGEGDNIWGGPVAEPLLFSNESGPASDVLGGVTYTLADSNSAFSPFLGGVTHYIGLQWCAGTMKIEGSNIICDGSTMGNEAQTDSLSADIHFYAEQARNNEDFSCDEVEWPTPTPQTFVGADLTEYSAPSSETCDVTVVDSESIQTAINSGSVPTNGLVCVDTTYNRTGDNTAIRINKDGVTVAALTQGILLDVPVVLDNDGTKITGFQGTIGQAEGPAEQAAFYIDVDAENVEITYNSVIGGSGAAIMTETGGANNGSLIAYNLLDGATQGIYLNPHTGTITIEYNDIDNNAAGIGGLNGAIVRYNEFEHSTSASEAIGIDGSFDANTATIHFNNFLDDTKIMAYHGTGFGPIDTTVPAEDNFFSTSAASQVNDPIIDALPEALAAYPHN